MLIRCGGEGHLADDRRRPGGFQENGAQGTAMTSSRKMQTGNFIRKYSDTRLEINAVLNFNQWPGRPPRLTEIPYMLQRRQHAARKRSTIPEGCSHQQ